MFKCPWCGNTNRGLMQDNGERPNSPDLMLLCTALMAAGLTVHGAIFWDEFPGVEPTCGEQWYPNEYDARLEYLRGELRAARISCSELMELQSLAEHIKPGDVELLEAAGVPEFGE